MGNLGVLEFTEYISPDGSVHQFDTLDRFIMTEEGYGTPPIDYITQSGPNQHGSTPLAYKLRDRIIQLTIRDNACNRDDYWAHRSELLNAIRPNRYVGDEFSPGVLRKKFSNGDIRDIKVFIQEGPVFAPRSLDRWDEFGFTEVLRFIAHDPIFFDPTVAGITFALSPGSLDELVFPITFSIGFDSSYYSNTQNIVYAGSWPAFPTIVITGPQSHPLIENLSTGEKIELNYNLSVGEVITIGLEYGNKTVDSNLVGNLSGVITSDSDLTTFHIAESPKVTGGINQIRVTSLGNTAASGIAISYYTRYYGI